MNTMGAIKPTDKAVARECNPIQDRTLRDRGLRVRAAVAEFVATSYSSSPMPAERIRRTNMMVKMAETTNRTIAIVAAYPMWYWWNPCS